MSEAKEWADELAAVPADQRLEVARVLAQLTVLCGETERLR